MSHILRSDSPVLLVDDEFLVLWALQDILEEMGLVALESAATVSDALHLIEEQEFEFAFLDVNLGAEKSFEIAEALEERGTPFAFVTGYGRAGLEGKFQDAQVLTKPVDRNALFSALKVGP